MLHKIVSGAVALAVTATALVSGAANAGQTDQPTPLHALSPSASPGVLDVPQAPRLGAAATGDALDRAVAEGRLTEAQAALRRAESLFEPATVRLGRFADAAGRPTREATLVLRDLALRTDELPPQERHAARRLLARPTDDSLEEDLPEAFRVKYGVEAQHSCSTHLCIHWVAETEHAPPATDEDEDGVPDWVQTNNRVFERVWRHVVDDYGYRAPKSDESSPNPGPGEEPDGRLDVYLADLGGLRSPIYGYCTTDDPEAGNRSDVSAYCVVDNDFASTQFAGARPLGSLRATAAHEFFHAVQGAYDFSEDAWLMEGTATWMEDEVFDGINDNYQYFPASPLTLPGYPVDWDGTRYGSWVFWRFLVERFGNNPAVVRQVWARVDASPSGPDEYSLQAVRKVTAARGLPFRRAFARFGAVNQIAKRWYDEGRHYPQAPVSATFTLTRRAPSVQAVGRLVHLSSVHAKLRPGVSLTGRWRLRLRLNLPKRLRGSAATVTVHRRDGGVRLLEAKLDRDGDGRVTVPFSRGAVRFVVLTLTNASPRFACRRGQPFSCRGASRDDGPDDGGLRNAFAARAIR